MGCRTAAWTLAAVLFVCASVRAQTEAAPAEPPLPPAPPVWVGIEFTVSPAEEARYLVGAIEASAFEAIRRDKYGSRWLLLADIRYVEEDDEEGAVWREHRDELRDGQALIRFDSIQTIELLRGDPLRVAQPEAVRLAKRVPRAGAPVQ